MTSDDISVAIPTYQREGVLLDTVEALLRQHPAEILIVDQTLTHEHATQVRLDDLAAAKHVRWIQLSMPSIPAAMNVALRTASRPLVLFVDDDVVPAADLVCVHAASYGNAGTWAVAGQVLQPGERPEPGPHRFTQCGLRAFLDFPFNSTEPAWVENVMAGNLSVRRDQALAVGGFDENFVGAAYRFETEFCRRLIRGGGRVLFQPAARIDHLRAPRGGIRSLGAHQSSASPLHGVGDYYFALRQGFGAATIGYVLRRPIREVCTRFHLRRPWWIVPKLVGEARALAWAWNLRASGPRFARMDAAARSNQR